ncbi:MAG: hypothetical protein JSU69_02135, partial [Candidatus Zixiibacteriota bacterium]
MPGINVVVSSASLSLEILKTTQGELTCKKEYSVREAASSKNLSIVFSEYEGYPVHTYKDDRSLILIEGLIYNKSDSLIQSELGAVIEDFINNQDYKRGIRDFIDTSDGEYLILVCLKDSGDILVFNDRWARLPVFYSVQDDRFVLSR